MPRSSAEERSASFYRAGKKAPEPPKGMSAAARRIWREIVTSKPVDWFDRGSLQTLRIHCEVTVRANEVNRDWAKVKPGSAEFRRYAADMKMITGSLATTNRQLRLTVQHKVDSQGQQVHERAPEAASEDEDLIGGAAVHRLRAVK